MQRDVDLFWFEVQYLSWIRPQHSRAVWARHAGISLWDVKP